MQHRTKVLASAWEHQAATEVTAFAVCNTDRPEVTRGRASVVFETGAFELRLTSTPDDLRALAAVLMATADDQEAVNNAQAVPL